MRFWVSNRGSPTVFIITALVLILGVGQFEFWLSTLKQLVLIGVILLLLIIAVGGGPTEDRPRFHYWANAGAFAEHKVNGAEGRLLEMWAPWLLPSGLVDVTVGGAKNPRLSILKAGCLTLLCISSAAASLLVVAIKIAKIKGVDYVINGCLVVFVFSAANSDFYTSSRTLYGIAVDGKAPRVSTHITKSGVPFVSLALCGAFCALLTWISIPVSHIFFCDVLLMDPAYVPYRAPLDNLGILHCARLSRNLELDQGHRSVHWHFRLKGVVVPCIGIPVYLSCIFGFKTIKNSHPAQAKLVDIVTGVPEVTFAEERAAVEPVRMKKEAATGKRGTLGKVYR
ncbi:Dicarboxylic amino acid permease 2 [Colletotrichum chlorophyti]|uniref:Dicarboxylic amino acid permease 2 n=1 Tax=Colletotrichum chlorophyti TaxID=708187 RepID=A0A1Q8S0M1_9PEZI|nr:Dicarboxylic amino acid permease 2 [Colletotrichum chlorophyti]